MDLYKLFCWCFIAFNIPYGIALVIPPLHRLVLSFMMEPDYSENNIAAEYITVGCGLCCFSMSFMIYFLKDITDKKIKNQHMIFQTFMWIAWTIFDLVYAIWRVTILPVGIIQIILCAIMALIAETAHLKESEESLFQDQTLDCARRMGMEL